MGSTWGRLVEAPNPPTYSKEELEGIEWITPPDDEDRTDINIPVVFHKASQDENEWKDIITVLFSGPHNSDLGTISKRMQSFSKVMKVNVICFDYSGYGLHEVSVPWERQSARNGAKILADDFEDVYNWAIEQGVRVDKMILMSEGLGCCPMLMAYDNLQKNAKKDKKVKIGHVSGLATGLILLSPVTSLSSMISSSDAVSPRIAKDIFHNLKRISTIQLPVLLVSYESMFLHVEKFSRAAPVTFRAVELESGNNAFHIEDEFDCMDAIFTFFECMDPRRAEMAKKILRAKPNQFKSPEDFVSNWLKDISAELTQHAKSFLMYGYQDEFALSTIDVGVLQEMGLPESHITLILNDINEKKMKDEMSKLLGDFLLDPPPIISRSSCRITAFSTFVTTNYQGLGKICIYVYNALHSESLDFAKMVDSVRSIQHENIYTPIGAVISRDLRGIVFPSWDFIITAEYYLSHRKCPPPYDWALGIASHVLEALVYISGVSFPLSCTPSTILICWKTKRAYLAGVEKLITEKLSSPFVCKEVSPQGKPFSRMNSFDFATQLQQWVIFVMALFHLGTLRCPTRSGLGDLLTACLQKDSWVKDNTIQNLLEITLGKCVEQFLTPHILVNCWRKFVKEQTRETGVSDTVTVPEIALPPIPIPSSPRQEILDGILDSFKRDIDNKNDVELITKGIVSPLSSLSADASTKDAGKVKKMNDDWSEVLSQISDPHGILSLFKNTDNVGHDNDSLPPRALSSPSIQVNLSSPRGSSGGSTTPFKSLTPSKSFKSIGKKMSHSLTDLTDSHSPKKSPKHGRSPSSKGSSSQSLHVGGSEGSKAKNSLSTSKRFRKFRRSLRKASDHDGEGANSVRTQMETVGEVSSEGASHQHVRKKSHSVDGELMNKAKRSSRSIELIKSKSPSVRGSEEKEKEKEIAKGTEKDTNEDDKAREEDDNELNSDVTELFRTIQSLVEK